MYNNNPNNRQVAVLPEPGEVGAVVLRGAAQFARRYKYTTASYVTGLALLILLSTGIWTGRTLTRGEHRTYYSIMNSIDLQAEYDASNDYWVARQAYQATKGWFWSCDSLCQRNKKRMERAERVLNDIRKEGEARMRDAKQTAGVTSTYAVEEMQDSFWQHFSSAKQFAKRQTMWDVMFMTIRSMSRGRDESWFEFGIKILIQILINLSTGLVMALIFFVFGLWSIVQQYSTNPLLSVLAFVLASCAAFSFVVTYLMAVTGAAASTVYGVLKLAESSARQQRRYVQDGHVRYMDGPQGYRRQQQRPHYD